MPQVTYVQPDGRRATCQVAVGESVLDGALDNGIPGILGQCGGAATCATCHCYLLAAHPQLPAPAHGDELELLDYVLERRPNSRLACQIRLENDVTAVEVAVPGDQL